MKEPTKICKGCSKELPLSDYSNEPRNKDGKNGKCKLCVKTEAKIRRSTPEYREKMRVKRMDPEFKSKKAASDKAYRKKVNENKPAKEPRPKMSREEYKKRKAESDKRYAEKNKKRIAAYQKQYRIDNAKELKLKRIEYTAREEFLKEERARRKKLRERESDRIKADKRKEYLNNIERYKKYAKLYRESIRGRAVMSEAFARYRSKRRNASDGTVTEKSLKLLKEIQKNCCAYCLIDLNKLDNSKVHLDHIYPISKGGLHSITNVVWSCAECNQRKNSAIEGWNILTERISFEQME